MLGDNCSSSCPTRDHETWGQCQRSKRQMVGYCRSHLEGATDRTRQKKWDRELSEYKAARDAGIQPDGTTTGKVRFAVEQSEKAGLKYGEEFRVIPREDRKGFQAVTHKEIKEITDAASAGDNKTIFDTARGSNG